MSTMSNIKRITATVLIIGMMLSLVACGNGKGSESSKPGSEATISTGTDSTAGTTAMPDNSQPITYRLMAKVSSSQGDWSEYWLFKDKLKDEFNITIEVNQITGDGWNEKKNLAFATKDLPDFFLGNGEESLTEEEIATYGSQGLLFAVEKLVSKETTPVIYEKFETYPELKKSLYSPDGHIYCITGAAFRERELSECRAWTNTTWAEETTGIPTTINEYYEFLKAIKASDPKRIPLSGRYGDEMNNYNDGLMPILTAFGFLKKELQVNDGKVIFVPADSGYKEFITFMNKLYTEGLLDNEYFTQTEDQFKAKIAQGIVGCFTDFAQWLNMPDTAVWSNWNTIDPMTSELNPKKVWPRSDVAKAGGMTIINGTVQPERLLQLVDWSFTDEGARATVDGPKLGEWKEFPDVGYEIPPVDERFKDWKVPPDMTIYHFPEDKYANEGEWTDDVVTPGYGVFPNINDKKAIDVGNPLERELSPPDTGETNWTLTNNILTHQYPYYVIGWPTMAKTAEESDELGLIRADLIAYSRQMTAKMITGDEPIANFEAYIQGCKDRKLDRYLELYQIVYDRYSTLE